jgi:hypothetical protein
VGGGAELTLSLAPTLQQMFSFQNASLQGSLLVAKKNFADFADV